jgi:hypothetical protein
MAYRRVHHSSAQVQYKSLFVLLQYSVLQFEYSSTPEYTSTAVKGNYRLYVLEFYCITTCTCVSMFRTTIASYVLE